MFSLIGGGHRVTNARTNERTDEQTDGWTDGQRELKGQLAARCPKRVISI